MYAPSHVGTGPMDAQHPNYVQAGDSSGKNLFQIIKPPPLKAARLSSEYRGHPRYRQGICS